tara:strand:+ start:449 stop:577 length:129 start_codon:yes stop_codon:yes gene_type:complete
MAMGKGGMKKKVMMRGGSKMANGKKKVMAKRGKKVMAKRGKK